MIDEQGMTEEELERTRAAALSSRLLAMQSNGTLCQMLALDILFGLPLEAFEQQTDAIRNMDLARMNAFIRKVLDPAQPRSCPSCVRLPGSNSPENHFLFPCPGKRQD